jgi:hypothetical protein
MVRCQYIEHSGLSDSTQILQTTPKKCAPVTYFHLTIKIFSFLNYHRPSHGSSSGKLCCKPRKQHLVQLHKLRWFQSPLLEKALHTFTWCQEWWYWSICFFTSYTDDNPVLHKVITTLWFLPLLSLLIIGRVWGDVKLHFSLASTTLFTHLEIF